MFVVLFIFSVQAMVCAPIFASSRSTTTLVTAGLDGTGANRSSFQRTKTLSADGRFTVFSTEASDIILNDTNNTNDIFIYDRITKKTELISATPAGIPGDEGSFGPTISADGRYVAYATNADTILPRTADMCYDDSCTNMIIHDRQTGMNKFANLDDNGKPLYVFSTSYNTISADGHSVVFNTASERPNDTNGFIDTYIHNTQTNTTKLVSVDNDGNVGSGGAGYGYSLSADGRYVALETDSVLTSEDVNEATDVYLRDTVGGKTSLISKGVKPGTIYDGSGSAAISDNGQFVAFESYAENLIANDTNKQRDVFVHNLATKVTKRISNGVKGQQANSGSTEPSMSSDGRFVVYTSDAKNLVRDDTNNYTDIFLYDSSIGLTRRINRASHDGPPTTDGNSYTPVISGDGRAVMFMSSATKLTPVIISPTWTDNTYLVYNPVVNIPYYDSYDLSEILY